MRTPNVVCIAIVSMAISPAINAEEAATDTPASALTSYYEALKKGDLAASKKQTAAFEMLSEEYISKYTEKYSEGAKAGKLAIKLVPNSLKVLDDCAVVIFEDGNKERPDYDPAYLIKQDGKWKVFLKLTKWDRSEFKLSEDQRNRFAELEEWFDKEKDKLYGR